MSMPTLLPSDVDGLTALLEQVRAEIIAVGFFAYSGPDALVEMLLDALDLPDQVVVIETRME